ncbi:hypothetical protein INT44_007691 [Umbelopsis vinacea]|uniref:BCAS3 domain-containing protein n=1 Tax=Umbelopsis vinacea TaxID=44442 RepID=A0A8H7PJM7_9FUNG|nr:hypothetical protein INT44_007691 [Umbelopsis vinacea]
MVVVPYLSLITGLSISRDPTSLESLSSGISRISSYVASNLPKKRTSLPSFMSSVDPQYNTHYVYGVPQSLPSTLTSEPSEQQLSGAHSSEPDTSTEVFSSPTFAAFDTMNVRRKDQKGLGSIKCLAVGYHDGFQIWDVSHPDNIHELCSIRDEDLFANVTAIHSLVTPRKDKYHGKELDKFEKQRPLVAIVSNHPVAANESAPKNSHEGNPVVDPAALPQPGNLRPQTKCRVQIYSLSTHQVVKTLDDLDSEESLEVTGIQSNDRVIALATNTQSRSRIHVLSSFTLEPFTAPLTDVFHEPGKGSPFTLGSRFIAYATSTPVTNAANNGNPGSGGISGAGLGVLSGEKDVKDAAKEVAKEVVNGVKALSEYGYQTLSNYFTSSPVGEHANMPPVMPPSSVRREVPFNLKDPNDRSANGHAASSAANRKAPHGGMIMVRDILKLPGSPSRNLSASVLAHYRPHSHPIQDLTFNSAGTLLMSVSNQGHTFHVFSILPSGTHTGSNAHLYSLLRGYTDARVEDSKFSADSLWCAVSTARGTTHLYAINPDGGRPEILGHVRGKARNSYAGFAVPRGPQQPKPVSQGPAVRIKQRTPMPNVEAPKPDASSYPPPPGYQHVVHPAYGGQSPPYFVPQTIPPPPLTSDPKTARAKLITTFLSTTKPTYLFRGNQTTPKRQNSSSPKPGMVNLNSLASITSPSLRNIREKATSLGSMITSFSGSNGQHQSPSPSSKGRPSSWISPSDKNNDNRVFGFEEEETTLDDDATKVIGDEVGYQDMYSFHPNGIMTLHRCCIATGIVRRRENGRMVERIELSVREEDIAEWRVSRALDWDEIKLPLEISAVNSSQGKKGPQESNKSKKAHARQVQSTNHTWLSNAEISTYPVTPDDHNLWSLPQFRFQMYEETDSKKLHHTLNSGQVPPTKRLLIRRDMPEPISRRVGRVNKTMARSSKNNEDGNMDEALAELEDNLSKAMQTTFSSSPYGMLGSSPIGTKRISSSAGNASHSSRPITERVPSLSFEDAYLISMGGGATGFEHAGGHGNGFSPPSHAISKSTEDDSSDQMQGSSLIRFDDEEVVSADFDMDDKDAVQVVAENFSQGAYHTVLQGDQVFSPDGDNEVAYPSDSILLSPEIPESI